MNQNLEENKGFVGQSSSQIASSNAPIKKEESWWELIKFIIVLVIIVVPFRMYVAQPFIVSGASMDQTFHQGDYLIVDELSYLLREPKRGEVIIFKNPQDTTQYFIKRVIGLPGETVMINGNDVSVISNGKKIKLDEPYLGSGGAIIVERKLKDNEIFVMGDNRRVSYDSRTWGPLSTDLIKGRAFLRLFPPQDISYLPGEYDYKN